MQLRFGEFVLDTDTRELLRDAHPVHLTPKAFQLLQLLVEARPRALSKADLTERLWPDTFVVEANLSNLVGELRTAVGDNPRRPQFIRTVHGFGYAFRATAAHHAVSSDPPDAVYCRLVWSTGRVALNEGDHMLGRDPDLELNVESPSVSRRHARLRIGRGETVLEDLGSKNGTYVNGNRVSDPVRLSDGDEIQVGSVRLTFRVVTAPPSTETEMDP